MLRLVASRSQQRAAQQSLTTMHTSSLLLHHAAIVATSSQPASSSPCFPCATTAVPSSFPRRAYTTSPSSSHVKPHSRKGRQLAVKQAQHHSQRIPRRNTPITSVALREMIGAPAEVDESHLKNETDEERHARLELESKVRKAAEIEAKRMMRNRVEIVKPMGEEEMSPVQRKTLQEQKPAEEAATIATRQTHSASTLPKGGPSPFKSFNPFFDYGDALEQASRLNAKPEVVSLAQTKQQTKMEKKQKRKTEIPPLYTNTNTTAAPSRPGTTPPVSSYQPPPFTQRGATVSHPNHSSHHIAPSTPNEDAKTTPSRPPPRSPPSSSPSSVPDPVAATPSSSSQSTLSPSPPTFRMPRALAERQKLVQRGRESEKPMEVAALERTKKVMKGEQVEEMQEDEDGEEMAAQFDIAQPDEISSSTSASSSAATSSSTSAPRRGPAAPDASIRSNKHSQILPDLDEETLQAEAAQQASGKKKKKKKSSTTAAFAKSITPGADGKLPLSSTPPILPQQTPWHPAFYVKQFLRKIHPDLYHSSTSVIIHTSTVSTTPGAPQKQQQREEQVSGAKMVQTNQETVGKFNAIVDYYKHIKTLPPTTQRIPSVPVLPPHPQSISFYCRVPVTKAAPDASITPAASSSSDTPKVIKLFEGEWKLDSYDLSSLPRLISQLDAFFIRLCLTADVELEPSVRSRWELLIRQRAMQRDMYNRGETHAHDAAGGYLRQDPTPDSQTTSPGRYRQQYLSYYAQTKDSHTAISAGRGYRADEMYNPLDPHSVKKLPTLIEQMMRAGLLKYDVELDMLQRLQALQTLITVVQGYNLNHLYVHLWIGISIRIMPHSYEYDDKDHNYRYSQDELQLPWNFEKEKFVELVRCYLHAYHRDNPQGLLLLEKL